MTFQTDRDREFEAAVVEDFNAMKHQHKKVSQFCAHNEPKEEKVKHRTRWEGRRHIDILRMLLFCF